MAADGMTVFVNGHAADLWFIPAGVLVVIAGLDCGVYSNAQMAWMAAWCVTRDKWIRC
jgi:hypothetical protein